MNERSVDGSLAPGAATLAAAVTAVSAIAHEGRSADDALQPLDARVDRSAIRAITLGTVRWYLRLAPAIATLVARPADQVAPALRALLVTAAHQIEYSRAAPEVSVHLAVDAARALGFAHATGFVNAVLRRFVREREQRFADVDRDVAARHAHPAWLVERLQRAWPTEAQSILAAANSHPPMTLRVDTRVVSLEAAMESLRSSGRVVHAIDGLPGALTLESSVPVTALPGFSEGWLSVQDAGAQLAAWALDLSAGQRVLDACAAPGGKTAHILQREPDTQVYAVDIEASRLALVAATLKRIGREAVLKRADLTQSRVLDEEAPFDRILVDAPCSSTGVIRRHPDIKLLRRESDIAGWVRTQRLLLRRAFERLAPGGRLVYATCSVLPEENVGVVGEFLAEVPQAVVLPWPEAAPRPPGAHRLEVGMQWLPGGAAGTDGFYYACLGREKAA